MQTRKLCNIRCKSGILLPVECCCSFKYRSRSLGCALAEHLALSPYKLESSPPCVTYGSDPDTRK